MHFASQIDADYARARRVVSLTADMAPTVAPVIGTHVTVSLQPSPTTIISDQPILTSVSLGGHTVGPLEMRYILYTLQDTHNSLQTIARENTGIGPEIWNRCEAPHDDEKITITEYARGVFGSTPPIEPATTLFTGSPIPSIDPVTWNILQARCVHHPIHAVCERLCEMAVMLTGEQWYDLWSSVNARNEVNFLIFGCTIQAWYLRDICSRALPITLDPSLLEHPTPRGARHVLGATLRHLKSL
jgi:hypothetical protein